MQPGLKLLGAQWPQLQIEVSHVSIIMSFPGLAVPFRPFTPTKTFSTPLTMALKGPWGHSEVEGKFADSKQSRCPNVVPDMIACWFL